VGVFAKHEKIEVVRVFGKILSEIGLRGGQCAVEVGNGFPCRSISLHSI
jgi:hypothetical protein